jgi:hypothetical protein
VAETQVLASEPGYKKAEFRSEFLERRRDTIDAMRPQLRRLIVGLMRLFEEVVDREPEVDLTKLRVEETILTKDGKMVLTISKMGLLKGVRDDIYHVDELVGEMFEGDEQWRAVSGEVAQFVSALVNQFAFIRKRNENFQPGKVAFGECSWNQGHAVFDLTYDGQPMGLKSAGW